MKAAFAGRYKSPANSIRRKGGDYSGGVVVVVPEDSFVELQDE